VRKGGSGLDLAIAVGICLAELGLAPPAATAFLGELALDGEVRHVGGILVAARWLARHGVTALFVPVADAAEAALAAGPRVYPCTDLASAIRHLTGAAPLPPCPTGRPAAPPSVPPDQALASISGPEATLEA